MLCLSYWVSIHSETWQFSVETAKHLSWLILCLKGYRKVYDRVIKFHCSNFTVWPVLFMT